MRTRATAVLLLVAASFGCANSEDVTRLTAIDRALDRGQYERVIREATEYLEDYPNSYLCWNLLGWGYLKTEHLEEAEQCFDTVLRINDRWDNAYVGKGVLYRKTDELDKARESYAKAISLAPDNAEAFRVSW
jgi:tetratricopeptide (TPR) repeat protein